MCANKKIELVEGKKEHKSGRNYSYQTKIQEKQMSSENPSQSVHSWTLFEALKRYESEKGASLDGYVEAGANLLLPLIPDDAATEGNCLRNLVKQFRHAQFEQQTRGSP